MTDDKESMTPGVVWTTVFVSSEEKIFKNYILYIDRDEATRETNSQKYDAFVGNYMDDKRKTRFQTSDDKNGHNVNEAGEKQSSLFTASSDALTIKEKETLRQQFSKAQDMGSPMWQHVISFDNEYLKECGILSSDGRQLNEAKLRNTAREGMETLIEAEKMPAPVWAASIHYNTDNIHIHIALVEPIPTRKRIEIGGMWQYKGKVKEGSIKSAKSRIVNTISDQGVVLNQINEVMNKQLLLNLRGHNLAQDIQLKKTYKSIMAQLPKDRREWAYGHHRLAALRPQIDDFVDKYIRLYATEDYDHLNTLLAEQQKRWKRAYGAGSDYQNYFRTKIDEVHKDMGNSVLKQMKNDAQRIDNLKRQKALTARQKWQSSRRTEKILNDGFWDLKMLLHQDFDSMYNQIAYERMMNDIENTEHQMEI